MGGRGGRGERQKDLGGLSLDKKKKLKVPTWVGIGEKGKRECLGDLSLDKRIPIWSAVVVGGGQQRGGWGRKGRRAGEWSQRPLTPGKKNNEGKGKVLVICNQTRNWRNLHGWGREREGSEKETWWSKQETEGMNRGEDVKGRGQRKRHGDPNKKQKVWTGGGEDVKGRGQRKRHVVQTRNWRYGQGWGHEREGPEKETWWSKQETEGMDRGEDMKGRGQRKRHSGLNKKQKVWTGVRTDEKGRGQRKRHGGPNKKQKAWTGVRMWKGGARRRDTMVQTRNRRYEQGWGHEREGPEKETLWSKQETEGMNMGEDEKGRGQRKRHGGPNKKQKVWTGRRM